MGWHIAQINIAKFRVPRGLPVNAEFEAALDEVNALAEASPGFVWRMTGEGGDDESSVFADRDVTVNMTVWETVDHLAAFAYRNLTHRAVMRRRAEWFVELPAYLALWWIEAGGKPSLREGKERLDLMEKLGPTADAFDFRNLFPPPS